MQESDRVKLLGRYRTPRFRYGDVVTCALRGDMKIVGLSNARIPWPKGRTGKRSRALILYGALAEAVKRESAQAVAYWFGVGPFTVWTWRKALGVDSTTPGTSALRSRWAPETCQSDLANEKREPTLHSPERAAKIAAARRGKKRPAHVVETMRRANLGKRASKATRRKMSDAQKRRGTVPPLAVGKLWSPEEDAMLGTMTDADVAARIGRQEEAVSARRFRLGVAAFTKRSPRGTPVNWTPAKDRLLGTMPDAALAVRLGCSAMTVYYRRKRLKISAHRAQR